jgi:tetratricopeptide (TPR) repeat protein
LLAAADFSQCIGLWPDSPWGYFNRGCVLARTGRHGEAVDDYTAALERDPKFAPAALNRGLSELELKRYEAALDDFAKARELGRTDVVLDAGRGIALEGLKRHREADAAFAAAFARAGRRSDPQRMRLCWSYGFAVAERRPEKARAAFDDVLLRDPNQPQALYGRAMLAVAAGRSDEAIAAFDRALKANPSFNEARRYRAVLLARAGDGERAAQDINWCLDREPGSAETLYTAACVAALVARAAPGPRATAQALELLGRALDRGVAPTRAEADPDLDWLRRDPSFRALLARWGKSGPREGLEPHVP